MIYLDSAATTFYKPKRVYDNVQYALRNLSSPGRGQYRMSEEAAEVVYTCREKAAKLFNVGEPDNVLMTFNATHGLNIAIGTLAYEGCKAVVSGYEHNAVMRPLRYCGADINVVRSELFSTASAIDAFDKAMGFGTSRSEYDAFYNMLFTHNYRLPKMEKKWLTISGQQLK